MIVRAGILKGEAPPAITGDNVYVAWWTNKTGNDEVIFRASTDTNLGESIEGIPSGDGPPLTI